jgi:hypothetical protein
MKRRKPIDSSDEGPPVKIISVLNSDTSDAASASDTSNVPIRSRKKKVTSNTETDPETAAQRKQMVDDSSDQNISRKVISTLSSDTDTDLEKLLGGKVNPTQAVTPGRVRRKKVHSGSSDENMPRKVITGLSSDPESDTVMRLPITKTFDPVTNEIIDKKKKSRKGSKTPYINIVDSF